MAGLNKKYRNGVSVSVNKGKLRITIPKSISGKPGSYIYLGLEDTPNNRKIAQAKAGELELDVLYERVDFSLEKYKIFKNSSPTCTGTQQNLTLHDLYAEYIETRRTLVRPGTWKNGYMVNLNHLKRSPQKNTNILTKNISYAQKLSDWSASNLSLETARRLMVQCNACLKWAIKSGRITHISKSPFEELDTRFRTKQKKNNDWSSLTFTSEERDKILLALKADTKGQHYYGYLAFCFYTGARPGEVIALTWEDIVPNFKYVNFNKVIVSGKGGQVKLEGLKTETRRLFPINGQLKEILLDQQKKTFNGQDSDLIFTSIKGYSVDPSGYFRDKIWKPLLKDIGMSYRKPYCTRHTFITLCLESGMSVKDLARLVGNSPEVIYKHYAAVNIKTLTVPHL